MVSLHRMLFLLQQKLWTEGVRAADRQTERENNSMRLRRHPWIGSRSATSAEEMVLSGTCCRTAHFGGRLGTTRPPPPPEHSETRTLSWTRCDSCEPEERSGPRLEPLQPPHSQLSTRPCRPGGAFLLDSFCSCCLRWSLRARGPVRVFYSFSFSLVRVFFVHFFWCV